MTVGVFLSVNEHCNCDRFTKGFNESTNLNLIPANRNNKAHMVINTLDVKQNITKKNQTKKRKKRDREKQCQEKEEVIKTSITIKRLFTLRCCFPRFFECASASVTCEDYLHELCEYVSLCVHMCVRFDLFRRIWLFFVFYKIFFEHLQIFSKERKQVQFSSIEFFITQINSVNQATWAHISSKTYRLIYPCVAHITKTKSDFEINVTNHNLVAIQFRLSIYGNCSECK